MNIFCCFSEIRHILKQEGVKGPVIYFLLFGIQQMVIGYGFCQTCLIPSVSNADTLTCPLVSQRDAEGTELPLKSDVNPSVSFLDAPSNFFIKEQGNFFQDGGQGEKEEHKNLTLRNLKWNISCITNNLLLNITTVCSYFPQLNLLFFSRFVAQTWPNHNPQGNATDFWSYLSLSELGIQRETQQCIFFNVHCVSGMQLQNFLFWFQEELQTVDPSPFPSHSRRASAIFVLRGFSGSGRPKIPHYWKSQDEK